jgi:hypothetical protein
MILQGLKPRIFNRLNKSSRKWLQEMSSVIWSLRTTPKRAMGFTSFFLVYGTEAVLPTDLEYGSPKIKDYDESSNQRARKDSLDQIYEAHDVAMMHSARYQQALRRYQSLENLAPRFQRGRLSPKAEPKQSRPPQVVPPWEGPYVVVEVLKPSKYKLANEQDEVLTNTWNIQRLCHFYP